MPLRHSDSLVRRLVSSLVLEAIERWGMNRDRTSSYWEFGWQQDADGYYRPQSVARPVLPAEFYSGLSTLAGYSACVEALRTDDVIGPHLNRLVGTAWSRTRLEADDVLRNLIVAALPEEGSTVSPATLFDAAWQKLMAFAQADALLLTTVVPLPTVSLEQTPVEFSAGLSLDRMSTDEVIRSLSCGVIAPMTWRFPVVAANDLICIRWNQYVPKVIRHQDEHPELVSAGEGEFGARPPSRPDLVGSDFLTSLRLFKRCTANVAGFVQWTAEAPHGSGMQFQVGGRWPYPTTALSPEEIRQLVGIYRDLAAQSKGFEFAFNRFNVSFERTHLVDRLVDLVIAAESVLLQEIDVKDRGEVRFRFSLRAAKFIKYADYTEQEVFKVMRRAYDGRSSIVHGGGSLPDTRLPREPSAPAQRFVDVVEDIVRVLIKQVLALEDSARVRQATFWEALLLSHNRSVAE